MSNLRWTGVDWNAVAMGPASDAAPKKEVYMPVMGYQIGPSGTLVHSYRTDMVGAAAFDPAAVPFGIEIGIACGDTQTVTISAPVRGRIDSFVFSSDCASDFRLISACTSDGISIFPGTQSTAMPLDTFLPSATRRLVTRVVEYGANIALVIDNISSYYRCVRGTAWFVPVLPPEDR